MEQIESGVTMQIAGLQKLTLLDYPGKVACTVFTAGCNYRCPFCHNASLVLPEKPTSLISAEEVLSFLKKRVGVLDGVCVTGGEPLLQKDLEQFLRDIKNLGFPVKLDTNGSNPQGLQHLISEGLIDYAAMDIKNCLPKYAQTSGAPFCDLDAVIQSAEVLMLSAIPFEFRTTVVKEYHTPEDMHLIGRWLQDSPSYYLQQFVASEDVIQSGLHAVDLETMQQMRDILAIYIEDVAVRGV